MIFFLDTISIIKAKSWQDKFRITASVFSSVSLIDEVIFDDFVKRKIFNQTHEWNFKIYSIISRIKEAKSYAMLS